MREPKHKTEKSLQEIQDEIKAERRAARRLRRDPYSHLIFKRTEILAFVLLPGTSKTDLQHYCSKHLHIKASADQLYRFVLKNLEQWPNPPKGGRHE